MAELGRLDLTPAQYIVLLIVSSASLHDQITVANVAGLDRATMTLVVTKLERSNLITREADPKDGRRKILNVTPAGAALLATAQQSSAVIRERQLGHFSADERREFIRLLQKFIDQSPTAT